MIVKKPLYQVLYEEIRTKILNSEYKKGTKLESVRVLSKKRSVSTTTVEKAYNQLLIEGYITSIPRSGYIVLDVITPDISSKNSLVEPLIYKKYENNKLSTDLFDIKSYKKIINKVINYDYEKLYTECDPRGEIELREEIRKFILKERDVKCDVNQIVIGPGIQNLLTLLLDFTNKSSVTYLAPEFTKAMSVFRTFNYLLLPKNNIDEITNTKSDFLYISPSNTYPTGDIIKVKERNDLIKWARSNNTYIIEDDYNFFIRYNSYTIPSIHSYDNGENVIYMGSFAKMIIPSIRISFMVLPVSLYNIYKNTFRKHSQGVSKLDQLSQALFMKEGLFKRHTKKLYVQYKEKNEAITKCLLKQSTNNSFKIRGSDSNLHLILDFKTDKSLKQFTKNCDHLSFEYTKIENKKSVIFPYSGIDIKDISFLMKKLLFLV
ncbi:MAG: HTH-type transcriptional regulatory protein GabR [Candidatus Izimaplasma bacterium HR2]|nr:MAG: HTH-type transcriptional regulatory protein GabR [Candidatus Izimaplasma bacterium HR2]